MSIWAGVIRVSDMNGRKADSDRFHSERDQGSAIENVLPNGDTLDLLPAELDISGGLPLDQRPSLLAAVEGVEAGRYAGIIVAYQSRLGRDTEHEEGVWRRVEAAGGQILMALDGLDTTTVDGRMLRRIRGAMNHADRERKIDEFDRLRSKLTEAGVWQARLVPRGYVKDPDTRKLAPGDTAPVVDAFRRRARNESIRSIALELGMSTSATSALLRNRVYLGELHVGSYSNLTAHDAIVTPDDWLRAQHPAPERPAYRQTTLLAGLVVCAGCGYSMSPSGTRRSYSCRGQSSKGVCPAPGAIRTQVLDTHIETLARAHLAQLEGDAMPSDAEIVAARTALQDVRAERDAFLQAVKAAELPADVIAESMRDRQGKVDRAETTLAGLLARGDVGAIDSDVLAIWDELDTAQRNGALRRLIECVIVTRAGGRGGGPGSVHVPVADRVRVVRAGAGVLQRGAPPVFPDPEAPHVLRV